MDCMEHRKLELVPNEVEELGWTVSFGRWAARDCANIALLRVGDVFGDVLADISESECLESGYSVPWLLLQSALMVSGRCAGTVGGRGNGRRINPFRCKEVRSSPNEDSCPKSGSDLLVAILERPRSEDGVHDARGGDGPVNGRMPGCL